MEKPPESPTFNSWREIRESLIGSAFFQISSQSADHALLNRGIRDCYPNHSTGNFSSITPEDRKSSDYLARQILVDPKAIEKHSEEISAIVIAELKEGKDTFIRRLAKAKKKQIDTIAEILDIQQSPLPHPPAMQQHMQALLDSLLADVWDRKEELLARHWNTSPSDELPPLCLWSDSAIDSWICESLNIPVESNGVQQIKDKRLKLQLLSMPFEIVTPEGVGISKLRCKYPCTLHKKRLKNLLPRIEVDHLRHGGFHLDKGVLCLQVLRCFRGWKPEVLSWMDALCDDPKKQDELRRMLKSESDRRPPGSSPAT